jgi:hypothetical protein
MLSGLIMQCPKTLPRIPNGIGSLLSAGAKQDQEEIGRIMQEAEGQGVLAEIGAGLKALSVAPVDLVSQGIGSLIPFIATAGVGKAVGLSKGGIAILQGVQGGAVGGGIVKGEIYSAVKDQLINSGVDEAKAEKAAQEAQAYNGKNLDQILLGIGLGVAASTTGADSAIRSLISRKVGKQTAEQVSEQAIQEVLRTGFVRGALKDGTMEFVTEGLQGGQERLAANIAVGREGFDVEPMRGVVGQATLEGAIGSVLGGGAGGISARVAQRDAREVVALRDAQKAADEAKQNNAPASAAAVEEQINQTIEETPDERVARLQREAQEGVGIELDEEVPVSGLPPVEPTPAVTPPVEAAVAPVEPVVPVVGAVEPTVTEVAPEPAEAVAPTADEVRIALASGVEVFHGGKLPDQITEVRAFGGLHAGTEKAAQERIGRPSMEGEAADVTKMVVTAQNPYLPEGRILDETDGTDRTQLFLIQQLPEERQKLIDAGYDVVPYKNAIEDPNSVSYLILDPRGYTREGDRYIKAAPEAAPAAVEPTPVTSTPVTPEVPTAVEPPALAPLRRVVKAEQTEEDVSGLVGQGLVELYKGQPVLTQAGLEALPEAERPRLTPEARKIQIDTRTSEAAAEAISKNLRIGVDQVPADVRMPAGWTIEGDIYIPPVVEAAPEFAFAQEVEAKKQNIKTNMIRFASGMSGISDLRAGAYTRAGFKNYGVGFDVGLLSKNAIEELADFIINMDTQAFIDSGAFSNFRKSLKAQEGGKTVEALNFDKIFEKYDAILDAIQRINVSERTDYPRPMIVMPDIIGDQNASLDLIDKYKNRVSLEVSSNTSIPIIPIPLGELSLSEAYNRIIEILKTNTIGSEINPENFVVGIPSNAKAVSKEDLAKFLRESKPPRIHFLGAAADRNISPLIDIVSQNSPETQVTADASKVRSAILSGVAKGKTREQAIFDALYQEDDPEVVLNAATATQPEARESRRAIITPQQDRDYLDAVERGDLDAASRVVEDVAKRAGDTIGNEMVNEDGSPKLYQHATTKDWTVYDVPRTEDIGWSGASGKAIWLAPFGSPVRSSKRAPEGGFIIKKLYAFAKNALEVNNSDDVANVRRMYGDMLPYFIGEEGLAKIKRDGWDAIKWNYDERESKTETPSPPEIIVFNPEQIKSAEPVTRDNQGNIIPPSQRFQQGEADIRYARTERDPEVQKAAQDLKDGRIDRDEYQRIVDMRMPIRKFEAVPTPANNQDMLRGLGERTIKRKDAAGNEVTIKKQDLVQAPESIAEGTALESRLDIPAYENENVWVVSLHEPRPNINRGNAGPVVAYTPTSVLRNVEFGVTEKAAVGIAAGKPKSTIATMKGEYVPMTAEQAYELATTNKEQWVEIGMNPVRHSYFYDKDTQTPVVSAEEVVQVGGMVLAKNPVFGKREDYLYSLREAQPTVGMTTDAVRARLEALGFGVEGMIRIVEDPQAAFEGRTIIQDGKAVRIELNASALRDNAAIDRVLNHEFAEAANADGALNKLVERLTPKEKKEINNAITRLGYEEKVRTTEEAARAIETLAAGWKGRGFFERAVARVEAWGSKLGLKLTRRAAEYIAARNLSDINAGFKAAYNRFINVRGEAREGRAFVTPEENARFMELAKDPETNREELQKMVDNAAEKSGYNIRLFRGGVQDYNIFRTENTPEGAAFFTNSSAVAQQFATERGSRGRVKQFFINASNPKTINFELIMEQTGPNEWVHSVEKMRFQIRSAKTEGYDSLIIKNVPEDAGVSSQYAIFNPEQIKSTDVVTRDNKGKIIPLNERFQSKTQDIRYALKQKSVDSIFSPEAFRRVGEGFKSRSKIIRMSIDDFLKLATQLPREQSQEAQKAFDAGIEWDSIPNFETRTDENGVAKIIGHEGRHRALVLKRAGYTEMPVAIIDRAIRWAEQTDPQSYDYVENFPTQLESERTKERIPFPFNREQGLNKYSPQTLEVRESRREPAPTFTEGSPEAKTLSNLKASMEKVDSASDTKGGKPETQKVSEIAANWMEQGGDERALQDAITENTNLSPANAQKVARVIAKQYDIQQQISQVPSAAVIPETITPTPEDRRRPKTTIQRVLDAITGVRIPPVKLLVNEKTALKDQIKLKAAAYRDAKGAQKETAASVVEAIKEMDIRGGIRPKQASALMKRAAMVNFASEKSVDNFITYAEKVVENANYDRDVADAKTAQKRAKEIAKRKNVAGPQKQVLEDIGKVEVKYLNDPREFAEAANYYMRAFKSPVSEGYLVVPDEEMNDYLSRKQEETQEGIKASDQGARERLAEKYGVPLDEVDAVMDAEDTQAALVQYAKREGMIGLINEKARDSIAALQIYNTAGMTVTQQELVAKILDLDVDGISLESRVQLIRNIDNILVNGQTNGVQKFVSAAEGQSNAFKASKNKTFTNQQRAWINILFGQTIGKKTRGVGAEDQKQIALGIQSIADTFRNIFGKKNLGLITQIMGFGDLLRGTKAFHTTMREITEETSKFFDGLTKRYSYKIISNNEGRTAEGVASYLIQQFPLKTEEESIATRRGVIAEDLNQKIRSGDSEATAEAELVSNILEKIDGNTTEEILANLKREFPANYEALMWYKNELLPKYKDFLKQFDENFNNQANNYNNPNYLPMGYAFAKAAELSPEAQRKIYNKTSLTQKQAANSIKRQDYDTLPKNQNGLPAAINYNLRTNVFNSLSDQLKKAYTSDGWTKVQAFVNSKDAIEVFGNEANREFMARRLELLQDSQDRRGYENDGFSRVLDGVAIFLRRLGIGIGLGGVGQVIKQAPDQIATTIANTGDVQLTMSNFYTMAFTTKERADAMKLMSGFSIAERGDAVVGGAEFSNPLESGFSNTEKFLRGGDWARIKDAARNISDVWLIALKKSDFWASSSGWLTYYQKKLEEEGGTFTNFAEEAELIKTDPMRQRAAYHAELMIDIYQGSSDPTRMARLSQRGKTGYENAWKGIFLAFNSFVLQQRTRMHSDLGDAMSKQVDPENKKLAKMGLSGTLAGILVFHMMRRYALPAISGMGAYAVYTMLGVDPEEPDEEKKKADAAFQLKRFYSEVAGNVLVGGFGSAVEQQTITALNQGAYILSRVINDEWIMDDEGEVMEFDKWKRDRAPFWYYESFKGGTDLGVFGIGFDQLANAQEALRKATDPELRDTLTTEEQRVLSLAAFSEIIFLARLNDSDVSRMFSRMGREIVAEAKERDAMIRRIQTGR